MVTAMEILLEQFSVCYDRNGWFVAIRNAVEGLTAEQASWKPNDTENSIWETLAHLTFYNNAYFLRFKDIDYEYPVETSDETFAGGGTQQEWENAVAKFDEVMRVFRDLIAEAPDSKFDQSVPQKEERKWWQILADINAHNAYHAGQILQTRKLQGSWNPDKGVS